MDFALMLQAAIAAVCVVTVPAYPDVAQQCDAPKVSTVKVLLRSTRNATGHWDTQVVSGSVQVDFRHDEPGDVHDWVTDVDQNAFSCGVQASTLDTIVHLRGGVGKESGRSRRGKRNVPTNSNCPFPLRHHSHSPCLCPSPSTNNSPFPPYFQGRGRETTHHGTPHQSYHHHGPPMESPSTWNSYPSPLLTPAAGYELFPGVGYYKYHPERLSWPKARQACTAEGAHLIILNSERENEVAKQIYARHPGLDWFMAGILEMGIDNEYFTIFGQPLESTGFTRFKAGQPNARGVHDYGGMHRSGEYADHEAYEVLPFICEIEL